MLNLIEITAHRSIKTSIRQTSIFLFSFSSISWLVRSGKDGFREKLFDPFGMATVDSSSTLDKPTVAPKELNNEGRETSAELNNIQDGGHVVSSASTSLLQQNSLGIFVPASSVPQVASTTNGVAEKEFPALQNATKPIPPSVFSYRFASPTSNQTPYYVSSDIVLSGGIAQQTRRRIVHNEVERRRKDKINNWILKLADVVPQCQWGKQSKNIVLEKTVEYITQVNDQLKEFSDLQQREQKLAQEVQQLRNRLGNATKENKLLKDLLKKHSIAIPRKILIMHDCPLLGSDTSGAANDSVTMTTAGTKSRATPTSVTMTTSKPLQIPSQVTINVPPVTMVTQVPVTSGSVAGSSAKEQSKKESIAYVAPFIITTNPVSMTTSTAVTPSPVVQVATPLVVQNVAGQLELNQLQRNTISTANYLSNPHQSLNPQLSNNLISSSASQPLQTVNIPVSSSQVLQNSHAGFSQHSVAAIMKVALQPNMSSSPINVVNTVPLATPAVGNNSTAVLNVQPAVTNSTIVASTTTMPTSMPSILPASNSLLNQQVDTVAPATASQSGNLSTFYVTSVANQHLPSTTTMLTSTPSVLPASNGLLNGQAGIALGAASQSGNLSTFYVSSAPNQSLPSTTAILTSTPSVLPELNSLLNQQVDIAPTTASQSSNLSTFYAARTPNQSLPVPSISQSNGNRSTQQQKESNEASKNQGGSKIKKTANKARPKSSSRTQNTNRSSQSKAFHESKTSSASNKRGAEHDANDTSLTKRTNTCNSQEPQGNMEEMMTLQAFNVNTLISGITSQGSSSAANNVSGMVPTRDDCRKSTVQVSTSQAAQGPRLSHSIASLAGLPQNIRQTSTHLHQHQQVSQLPPGNLSFSAESLLASSEAILPNIPHISTSVSENNANQQSSLTLAIVPSVQSTSNVVPSVHRIPNEQSVHRTPTHQSHTQSFSNYSAEALIGGNELIEDSVIAQDSQIQSRPSRTTYSDFSAESLIGSSDLNSSLSYAIDNLISSRSDANYNSTAMVSVNPNLLHSVKSNVSHDAGQNPLRALAALPDLVEQKSSMPSSQPMVLFNNCNISNNMYSASSATSAPTQFTFVNSNINRRTREGTTEQQGILPTVNSTNSVSVTSASFLKHSVDSITSSFYAVSNSGSSFLLGPVSISGGSGSGSSFQPQGSFGAETLSAGQLSFSSITNPFSPTRPFFTHNSTMGSFV